MTRATPESAVAVRTDQVRPGHTVRYAGRWIEVRDVHPARGGGIRWHLAAGLPVRDVVVLGYTRIDRQPTAEEAAADA